MSGLVNKVKFISTLHPDIDNMQAFKRLQIFINRVRRARGFARIILGCIGISCLMLSVLAGKPVLADPTEVIKFKNVTESGGIRFRHEKAVFSSKIANVMPWLTAGGASVAVGDFNNDGLDDIYFTSSKVRAENHLYRNEGNFRFRNVAREVDLADTNHDRKTGTSSFALWFDFDNDGWQDLLLLRFGKIALFKNIEGKKFIDITHKAGVYRHTNSLAAAAFDYNNDGYVDIYIGGYFPERDFHNPVDSKVLFESWETARNGGPNYLFHNNGNGTFTDVTEQAGLQDTGWAMAVGHGDLNNDGWQDIYVANDFGTDVMFKNMGNGKFKNISKSSIGVDTKKGMNTEIGDYNNDGFLDIYVTNMTEPYLHECNMLWRNNGDETFTDVSEETNSCDTDWGWGAKFVDFNNDSLLDLYVANGFISAGEKDYMDILLEFIFREDIDLTDVGQWPNMAGFSMAGHERNMLLIQNDKGFISVGAAAGVDSIKDSRGVAVADFDNDGRMDIVVSNVDNSPDIYRNIATGNNNWLALKLYGNGSTSNTNAIGARVTVTAGGKQQIREVTGGNGFGSQSSLQLHFGLGQATLIEALHIAWPDGKKQTFEQLQVNRLYRITQGEKKIAFNH